uniref:MULE transposase domain-containing protein n=1 Tax=Tanacetum cinerariifolium TaxID=118510 RepID=A0A6L2KS53_TANCI|nr:hypothetical protein [Tanacetum cinerariifolium]
MDDDCVTRKTDKGKEKMVDDCVTTEANEGNKRVVEDGENSNDSDDRQDGDFMVDKENMVDEVEVDMQNYYLNIDPQVEFTGCSSHSAISNKAKDVDKYVKVMDNDSFDSSESDEGDDIRKRKIKELLVKKHSLETRRELKLVKNDKERVRAICFSTIPVFSDEPNDGGPSNIGCSSIVPINIGCSSIVPINIGCSSIEPVNTAAKPSGKKQKKEVKAFQDQVQKKYHLDVSKMKDFRDKSKAYAHMRGDYRKQYKVLRNCCLELNNKNPGPLKDGFRAGMRDLLGLDGAFMKGPFPGQVLAAVGLDSNNGIYPVAYAIVKAENKDSWTWFLECLGEDLNLGPMSNFTFITDRQKGVIPAIASVFPCAKHRFCLKHIHENMKKRWRGEAYKDLLWRAARATTVQHTQKAIENMKKFNEEAFNWLNQIPPQHWSKSHFSSRPHSDVLLNNICECLNSKILDGRDMPIIAAIDYIRKYLMKRMVNVIRVIEKCDRPLTTTVTTLLETVKKEASDYSVEWNGGLKYEVGRPRKNRRRGAHEDDDIVKGAKLSRSWKSVTCLKCHQLGHNQRSTKEEMWYDMVFVPFTEIDNHKKCVTVGSRLLLEQDNEAYTWLLRSFLTTHEKLPTMIVTDQDGAIKLAVKVVVTESKHILTTTAAATEQGATTAAATEEATTPVIVFEEATNAS